MAKKRRPNGRKPQREKSPSMVSKLTNVAKVTLAAGAGVALFNNSKIGDAIKREIVPALAKSYKTYNESLLGSRKKAIDYYNAFEKSIGKRGKVLFKNLDEAKANRKQIEKIYKPKVGNQNSIFSFLHDIEQTTKTTGYRSIDKQTVKTFEQKAIEKMIAKYAKADGKDGGYDKDIIKQIVKSTVAKREELYAQS